MKEKAEPNKEDGKGDTMSVIYSEVAADEPTTNSFWMPNRYQSTVKRLDDGYRVCDQIVACFQERAKIERNYALMMDEWSRKWRPLVDASPVYGSLLRAWQAFLGASERLSQIHMEMQRALVSEDAGRIRSWQHDSYHRKLFGGFKETCELENGFQRAQKPWTKKLKKAEKAKTLYHKACRKEHIATLRESGTQTPSGAEVSPDRQRTLREEHQRCSQETNKIRERYQKALQELDRCSPRYMEEMETVFEQGQALEQRRIVFLKSAFFALHRRLDITADSSIQAVYGDLHQAIEEINDQEDLKLWRNRNGPGMPMNWPKFEDWSPNLDLQVKIKKPKEPEKVTPCSISPSQSCPKPAPAPIAGQRVRAVYDYIGQEADELSFKAGELLTKLEDEDEQGWCKGVTDSGHVGLYPANYVEPIQG
ncbi:PREDICTED: protein kinase C and casein kinase substrate in neurons protein 2-like isoform X1 [Thamnophis sirtalis]|uniref:Protein kinase C and casein kinase substrate in neurons protein 2-like isoform X1 n=1 Tax=Thamnophis sirtalis TaxID=35019 RepID=A0A6I9XYQ9_9SAUR|nr:PREDICTED: protein kinase C and casein kinase substrate in neurons protein 2-like isoform X1 [Thamnophis sirtalis]